MLDVTAGGDGKWKEGCIKTQVRNPGCSGGGGSGVDGVLKVRMKKRHTKTLGMQW